MDMKPWFERKFQFDMPLDLFPNILERLRGTPARLTERTAGVSPDILVRKNGSSWSIQEQVGHLLDLEPLWFTRINELMNGVPVLATADLQNRKTHEANHNAASIEGLLQKFKAERGQIISRLENLKETDIARTALHPRLQQPMNMMGLAFFVAEHDDHHVACITALRGKWKV